MLNVIFLGQDCEWFSFYSFLNFLNCLKQALINGIRIFLKCGHCVGIMGITPSAAERCTDLVVYKCC